MSTVSHVVLVVPVVGSMGLAQEPVPQAGAQPAAPAATPAATGTPSNNVTVLGAPTGGTTGTATTPANGTPGTPGTTGQPLPAPTGSGSPNSIVIFGPLMALMVVMILVSVFQGRKERKRAAELLSSIKRHDEVVMSSGIVGTVVDVTDEYVTVKVDDGRIRFAKRAVAQVLKPAADIKVA
jgi:preprotein translocase subunit YajC